MKKPLLFAMALSMSVAFAQNEGGDQTASPPEADPLKTTLNDSLAKAVSAGKMALGIHFGFPGFGADLGYKFNEYFMGRFRFNYLNINLQDYPFTFEGQTINMNITTQFTNFDLLVDIHPFKSKFKIIAGVGYFANALMEGSGGFTESINFGEIEFTPEDIGELGLRQEFPTVAPYLGFGFGRAVPNKGMGFGIEIGSYYIGKPTPEIIATGMLSDTKDQEAQLAENLESYNWLPFMSFRISIKF